MDMVEQVDVYKNITTTVFSEVGGFFSYTDMVAQKNFYVENIVHFHYILMDDCVEFSC